MSRKKRQQDIPTEVRCGSVVRQVFRNETGWTVLRVMVTGRIETWIGVMEEFKAGAKVEGVGTFVPNKRDESELDFKVSGVTLKVDRTKEGICGYLTSGIFRGLSDKMAERIYREFGDDTLDVLDKDPATIKTVRGLSSKMQDAISEHWISRRAYGTVLSMLQRHGATGVVARRIYDRYGSMAVQILRDDPYRLAIEVRGVGFKTADALAMANGIPRDSDARVCAGVAHVLQESRSSGHVFQPRDMLVQAGCNLVETYSERVEAAIDSLIDEKILVRWPGDPDAIYLADNDVMEGAVARMLVQLLHHEKAKLPEDLNVDQVISEFQEETGAVLAPEQRHAVISAVRQGVVVITGGPGTGKTLTTKAIVQAMERAKLSVALASPTGLASKRLGAVTGRAATTIHTLLGVDPTNGTFCHNASNPLPFDVVLIDEFSMVDQELCNALLLALRPTTRLVMVGDVDQLPSVGPGAVLRDVIGSNVIPTARLCRIFRQGAGSSIVRNAHAINAGEHPETDEGPSGEFYVLTRKKAEDAASTAVQIMVTRLRRLGIDPLTEAQVLTPMHSGPAGTYELNKVLQDALNPPDSEKPEHRKGGALFRLGDRVLHTRNWNDSGVMNGDIGIVTAVYGAAKDPDADKEPESGSKKKAVLAVTYGELVVEYTNHELDDLTLAYAISIHRSQGQEYRAVVVLMLKSHFIMLSRNLLYTGVTRGKKLVALITCPFATRTALARTDMFNRHTRLAERIRNEAAALEARNSGEAT